MEKDVFLVSSWAFGQRKSSEYPWGIEFPLFKLGYLPPVFRWLVFEKIQAVVVFFNSMLNVCDFLFFSDAVSFISVFIIFEPLLLLVFFDTYWIKLWKKRKTKGTDGIWTHDLLFTRQAL